MGEINKVDLTNIDSWENLKLVFDELKIAMPTEALNEFIKQGIATSGAIKKIDFLGLNEALQNTYEIIEKIKESSSRVFS
jgi:hypothetical protein